MAKIDTSKIQGYSEMTAEEKLKALENYEVPDSNGYVKKELYDRTASELASKKKELSEHLTTEEKEKLEQEQQQKDLQEKYDALFRESTIAKNKAKYLGLGYSEDLAEQTATAMTDGDLDTVFANAKKHLTDVEKSLKAEALKNTPTPDIKKNNAQVMTLKEFHKLSPQKRLEYFETHPDEYKELYREK